MENQTIISPQEKLRGAYKKSQEGHEDVAKQRYDRELVRKLYICGFNAGDIAKSGLAGIAGMSRMNVYITLYRDGTYDKFKDVHKRNRKKMKQLMIDTAISYMFDLDFNPEMIAD